MAVCELFTGAFEKPYWTYKSDQRFIIKVFQYLKKKFGLSDLFIVKILLLALTNDGLDLKLYDVKIISMIIFFAQKWLFEKNSPRNLDTLKQFLKCVTDKFELKNIFI